VENKKPDSGTNFIQAYNGLKYCKFICNQNPSCGAYVMNYTNQKCDLYGLVTALVDVSESVFYQKQGYI